VGLSPGSSPVIHSLAAGGNRVRRVHPVSLAVEPGTGCNRRADGVRLARLRGAAVAPEPYKEPSREPAAPAREAPSAAGAADGGGPVGEFFAVLDADWRLTGAQRARLTPAVARALTAG
jgi:hypothetical protein